MRNALNEKNLKITDEARLEKALIRLIGSTRRSRRSKNLIEVAKELAVAEKLLGSRKIVSEKIGISEEMLREFASVKKLSKSVKEMIKDGRLTSVDIAYRISMLPKSEQLQVARAYIEDDLSGKDVRDVVALCKRNAERKTQEVIKQVKSSQDIIQYIIRFRLREKVGTAALRRKFAAMLGDRNIVSLEVKGKIVNLTISDEGRKMLQKEAKKRGITKRKFINLVVERE
jgi:hypothetical protein